MNVFLDDLLNQLVHQVQEKVVPTLETITEKANERLSTPRPPPASTDLVYLTDRILISSQPSFANPPIYSDVGRDVRKRQHPSRRPIILDYQMSSMTDGESSDNSPEEEALQSSPDEVDSPPDNMMPLVRETSFEDDATRRNSKDTGEEESSPNQPTATDNHDNMVENPQEGASEIAVEAPPRPSQGENETELDRTISPSQAMSSNSVDTEQPMDEPRNKEIAAREEDPADTQPEAVSSGTQQQAAEPLLRSDTAATEDSDVAMADGTEPLAEQAEQAARSADSEKPSPETSPLHPTPDMSATPEEKEGNFESESQSEQPDPPNDENRTPSALSESTPVPEIRPEIQHPQQQDVSGLSESDAVPVEEATSTSIINIETAANEPDQMHKAESHEPTQGKVDLATSTPQTTDDEDAIVDDDENDSGASLSAIEGPRHDPAAPSVAIPVASTPRHQAAAAAATATKNSPATIVTYLDKRHGRNNYLAFSFMDEPPDDRTLVLFRRQIVKLGWWSPCMKRSETPSIPKLLEVCYAIHAYLQLDPSNVAMVYCSNGKTRTAIAMACYLKFAGLVQHCYEGFLHFLSKRGVPNPEATWKQLPPSLRLFFRQFDTVLDVGGFLNRKPLVLRAIALQGIPVEFKPCLDIWDSSQQHVYSSHPEMWHSDAPVRHRMNEASKKNNNKPTSQWADEEGFYKVNVVLEGDFLLLCRFGGDFAHETTIHDPTKILFRYANTTGFLSGGCPYELPPHKIDLMRRYSSHLDDDDFLVTLLFEADWESVNSDSQSDPEVAAQLLMPSSLSSNRIWRNHEQEACEEGWKVIFQHHSARPDPSDIQDFKKCYRDSLDRCADHLVCLALQLTNFDYRESEQLLIKSSSSFAWWQKAIHEQIKDSGEKRNSSTESKKNSEGQVGKKAKTKCNIEHESSLEILDILDEIDVTSNLEPADVRQFRQFDRLPLDYQVKQESLPTPTQIGGSGRKSNLPRPDRDSLQRDAGWMVPSIMYPRQGDITGLFGPNYAQFKSVSSNRVDQRGSPSIISRTRPRMPFFPRDRPGMLPPPSSKRQRHNTDDDHNSYPIPPYNPQNEAAMQLFLQLRHTGVNLPGLLSLAESTQQWGDVPMLEDEPSDIDVTEEIEEAEENPTIQPSDSRDGSMNREAKEHQEKKWEEAKKAELKEKESKKKAEDAKREGEQAKRKEEEQQEAAKDSEKDENASSDDVPLKGDPEFAKYFKMLKMGMPKEQILHAMTRDEKDVLVLDLDPNKSLKSQTPEEPKSADGDVPLKDDPEYLKYFKMLKMGLPVGAVKNALTKDGKDPTIMDLDPNKSLKSQRQAATNGDDGPPLKEDPDYVKYFKMLKMGLPLGAVKNALTKDGKDPSIMDLDPNKSLNSQMGGGAGSTADDGPPLKDDPEYSKYFKMLGMGLPIGAVKNAVVRDDKDPAIMDLDPNKSVKSQMGGVDAGEDTGPPLKEDPEYVKYFKMMGMGLPPGAVKNAIERDGKNAAVIDLDPNKSVAFQMKKKAGSAGKKPAKKKKRVRRKKIYWNPIDPGKIKEDSMWNIVLDSIKMDKLNYDVKEFEDLFTESADPADQKKEKKGPAKAAKKLVQVIEGKRDMNGGIVLARLKTEYSKIAEFVDKM
jgi:hypothetical protein